MNEALRDAPIGGRVELEEPGRVAEYRGDRLERVDGQRRGHHRHTRPRGGPRHREVAMPILGTDTDDADRGHDEGGWQLHAEELDRHVPLRSVDHHPWDDPPLLERRDVEVLGSLVAASPLDVGDDRIRPRRDRLLLQRAHVDWEFGDDTAEAVGINLVFILTEVFHGISSSVLDIEYVM
jgi:hypothetical protein